MKKYTSCLIWLILVMSYAAMADQPPVESWVARYNGPTNDDDVAKAIAIDNSGNVYVTGFSGYGFGYSTSDYATIKYDPNGNEKWVAHYNGPRNFDFAYAIAVDNSGNVYVTGESYGIGTSSDYATIKYDSNGNQEWVARYNGPGNGYDDAFALAIDSSNNVYVTGESKGNSTNDDWYDYATIKYDTNGNQLWVARYDGSTGGSDMAFSLVLDDSGNIYVAGGSDGNGSDLDYVTIKYDPNGNQLWVARYDSLRSERDVATDLVVDGTGNVFVTGQSYNTEFNYPIGKYVTLKYDPNGNQLWEAEYCPWVGWAPVPGGPKLAIDIVGNVYGGGRSGVAKCDTDGNVKWVADSAADALTLDSGGNIYVTGWIGPGPTSEWDWNTVKLDPNGISLWTVKYNGPGNSIDFPEAIAVDGGNIYVAGMSTGSGTGNDYATIKYTQNYPPVANAGPDQTVYAWIDGFADVTLDGSDSNDADGDTLTYKWTWTIDGNDYEANGVKPTIELPVGRHIISLIVNDGTVDSEPNEVNIAVIGPVEANLCVTPKTLNCKSFMPRIITTLRLPKGITKDQIDSNEPLLLYPGEIEAGWTWISRDFDYKCRAWNTTIFASFDKDELMNAIDNYGQIELAVVGRLKTGQYFFGTDTVRVISPGHWPWHKPWWNYRWHRWHRGLCNSHH